MWPNHCLLPLQEPQGRRGRPACRAPQVSSSSCLHPPCMGTLAEMTGCMRPQRAHCTPDSCLLPLQEPQGRRDRPACRAPQVSSSSCLHPPCMGTLAEMTGCMRPQRAHCTPDSCLLPLQEPQGRRDRPASRAPQVSSSRLHSPCMA